MNILIVNDDGYDAKGINKLALLAKKYGNVYVVAPDKQCSAMSHRITIRQEMKLKRVDMGIEDVEAYSLSGTPADCVKVALNFLYKDKIDYIFSGINSGYNMGYDIAYSGTIAAAMEGVMNGVSSIAFSGEYSFINNEKFDVIDKYFDEVLGRILRSSRLIDGIYNVNFPGCEINEVKGILLDRSVGGFGIFKDKYEQISKKEDEMIIVEDGVMTNRTEVKSDIDAIINNYISIGKVKSMVL